eukprot:GHVQ01025119.1.p1 GENE.GHVQ01025119.1~~GHVQ01025119.1.p1  ORF type:complete len:1467 (-),score=212.58 GHVQ01025119.1:374-4774(-)
MAPLKDQSSLTPSTLMSSSVVEYPSCSNSMSRAKDACSCPPDRCRHNCCHSTCTCQQLFVASNSVCNNMSSSPTMSSSVHSSYRCSVTPSSPVARQLPFNPHVLRTTSSPSATPTSRCHQKPGPVSPLAGAASACLHLASSPASGCSPFHSSSPASAFLSSLGLPAGQFSAGQHNGRRMHISTPNSNSSLLFAAAALAAAAAAVEVEENGTPAITEELKVPRRRRRRCSALGGITPLRKLTRRHTVCSDSTTVDTERDRLLPLEMSSCGLTEDMLEQYDDFIDRQDIGARGSCSPVSSTSLLEERNLKTPVQRACWLRPRAGGVNPHNPTSKCPPVFGISSPVVAELSVIQEVSQQTSPAQSLQHNFSVKGQPASLSEKETRTKQSSKTASVAGSAVTRSAVDKRLLLDMDNHSKLLYLYSAFHLLILVFTCGFFPKLNNSLEGRTSADDSYGPRYGYDDWSFYRNLSVPITTFMKSSVVWAVGYALLLRCSILFLSRKKKNFSSLVHRLYGLWCLCTLMVNTSVIIFGGMMSKSVLFPDVWIGTIYEGTYYDTEILPALNSLEIVLFVVGFCIDLVGSWTLLCGAFRHIKSSYDPLIPLLCMATLLGIGSFFMGENPSCNSGDHHWVNFADHHPHNVDMLMGDSPNYKPLRFPVYLPMADGVKIAVDVYLPHQYFDGFKDPSERLPALPTYVDITRYDRRMPTLWPFSMLKIWKEPRDSSVNVWSWQFVQALIPNGYAVVVVDTRGTGVSEGHREVDFSAEELSDFEEIVEWVKGQWWSTGELGMGGISYDGMTGLQAASLGGVKAAVALFTPTDVIGDLLAPGGMVCSSFVKDYVGLTAKFEEEGTPLMHHLNNPWHYPLHVILGFISAFGGGAPVSKQETVGEKALEEHMKNWDMGKVVQQVEYLDDSITLTDGRTLPVVSFGITESVMEGLAANNVNIYIAGGYCDSAIVRGSSRLYNYMKQHAPDSKPKLVLGPWTHSGRRSCSPYMGSYPCFEESMYLDLVRHLDCHLKGKCWGGVLEEQPVRYWQVGEEQWKASDTFPPNNLKYTELHFSNQPLSADLTPVEAEVPNGLVMLNNTVIRELDGTSIQEEEETDLEVRQFHHRHSHHHSSLFAHVVHDITQMTYVRLKKPGAHQLHYYHRSPPASNKPKPHSLQQHQDFLAKDSYVLKPKAAMYGSAVGPHSRISRHYSSSRGGHRSRRGTRWSSTVHDVVPFKVDYQATTGIFSRWLIAQQPFRMAVSYGNQLFPARAVHPMRQRTETAANSNSGTDSSYPSSKFASRLSFTTAAQTEPLEMVGSPWVKFSAYVSGCTEVSLFVYLEDVDLSNGFSHYVTEGKVVASHRVTDTGKPVPVGSSDVVHRSYSRKDYQPVQGSELVEMSLTLEPVAWTFQKGHAVRISMAGSDVDNFELRDHGGIYPVLPDKWQILVNDPDNFPAWVRLPTVPGSHSKVKTKKKGRSHGLSEL